MVRVFLTFLCAVWLTAGAVFADVQSAKISLDSIQINENTDPEIAALYQDLKDIIAEYDDLRADYISKLEDNAQKMRDKEQSTENKLLGATAIGTVGIGGMQALSALAESNADDVADRDMRAYLATFRCDYGQGRNIMGGETNIQLPGANDLSEYIAEYRALALNLQADKAALGASPGIESELVLDSAEMNLYDSVGVGAKKGAFTSLSRALMDENSADAAELAEQRQGTKNKLKTGATLAASGAAASIATNLALNSGDDKKNKSDEITLEYDKKKRTIDQKIADKESALQAAIDKNKRKIEKFNALLQQHKDFIATITEPQCSGDFAQYISDINALQPITDMLSNASNLPQIPYDLDEMRTKYTQCLVDLCNQNPNKEWVDGECRDKPQNNNGGNTGNSGGGTGENGGSAGNPGDGTGENGGSAGNPGDGTGENGGDTGNPDEPSDESVVDIPDAETASTFNEEECAKYPANYYWDGEKCVPVPANGVIPGAQPGDPHSGYNPDGTLSANGMTYEQWEAWLEQHRQECEKKDNWTWDSVERKCFENPPLDSPYCPHFNPAFPEITGGSVGGACRDQTVLAGEIVKIKTGEDSGTCTCSARACIQHGGKIKRSDGTEMNRFEVKPSPQWPEINTCVEKIVKYTNGVCAPFYEIVTPVHSDPEKREQMAHRACRKKCNASMQAEQCINEDPKLGIAYLEPSNVKNGAIYRCTCAADDEYFEERESRRVAKEEEHRLSVTAFEASGGYKHACSAFVQNPGRSSRCVEDVFADIQVTMLQAPGLVQAYIGHKYQTAKSDIICENTYFTSSNDDYLRCYDMDNVIYYEFRFDDITESVDSTIDESVNKALCHNIFGHAYIKTRDGLPQCKVATPTDCLLLNEIFSKYMAVGTKWVNNACVISGTGRRHENGELKTYAGIDNYVFCHGIQLQGSGQVQEYLKQYIKNAVKDSLGAEPRTVKCDNNRRRIAPKCGGGTADDVLRCYADGNPIDFVFDDLSENFSYKTNAGLQAMACAAARGRFTGENCIGIGEQQCNELRRENSKACPKCKEIKWDAENQICTLPAAKSAANTDKTIAIGTIAGAAVVGAVVTVMSAGSGSGAGVAIVLVSIETAGAALEIGTTIAIGQKAQEFLTLTNLCHDASCAEEIITTSMQRMANLSNDFTDAEVAAIDSELARLLNYIPESSDLWDKTTIEMYEQGFFDAGSWEPEQVVRAIGVVMQFASILTSLFKGAGKGLTKAGNVIKQRTAVVEKNLARAKKRLTTMRRGSKAYNRQTERIAELERQAQAVDGARTGRVSPADVAGESKSVRQSVRQSARDANPFTAEDIANDGAKLKRYDQLLERQRAGKLTQTEQQELNRIRNEWGNPGDDVIEAARGVALRKANAAELASAEDDLRKWENWAQEHPGQVKNMSRADRERVAAMRQRVSDLGGDPDAISPISANPANAGRQAPAKTGADSANSVVTHNGDDADVVIDVPAGRMDDTAEAAAHVDDTAHVADDVVEHADDTAEIAVVHVDEAAEHADDAAEVAVVHVDEVAEHADDVAEVVTNNMDDAFRNRDFNARFTGLGNKELQLSRSSKYWDLVDGKLDLNSPLTRIGNTDVRLVDFPAGGKVGRISGRPVVVVDVGGRKIPFYVSTGSAGKLEVPTGKWEVIFGIGQNADGTSAWFNKLGIDDIVSHYGSPELKQIADALDSRLGDLRDVTDIAYSAQRAGQGGIGNVGYSTQLADMDNVQNIRFLNSGMSAQPSVTNRNGLVVEHNKKSVSMYLRQLSGADVTEKEINSLRKSGELLEDFDIPVNRNVDSYLERTASSGTANVNVVEVTVEDMVDLVALEKRASKNFSKYLDDFKSTGDSVGLPKNRLTDEEWRLLNDELAPDGIRLESYTKDGKEYMRFVDDPNHPAGAARARAHQASAGRAGAQLSKAEKLNVARREGRAGFHGTDADIAETDNIRWSKGSHPSGMFDGVSIARQREAAENYAINRLIKKQNPHMSNGNFVYDANSNVLTITSDRPINMANKKFYIYELAADENGWMRVGNGYAGQFEAYYNKGQQGTEWLAKHEVDLDDLIARGRVRINAPSN
ncbi:MAG: hypothetical protein K2M34_03895 [Alphaproteobacteria bacterium]|nr:hypothetical protein [Alphaproteobacteria bacterium]